MLTSLIFFGPGKRSARAIAIRTRNGTRGTIERIELIQIHKDAPWILEERRQVLATIVQPQAEKPDEV